MKLLAFITVAFSLLSTAQASDCADFYSIRGIPATRKVELKRSFFTRKYASCKFTLRNIDSFAIQTPRVTSDSYIKQLTITLTNNRNLENASTEAYNRFVRRMTGSHRQPRGTKPVFGSFNVQEASDGTPIIWHRGNYGQSTAFVVRLAGLRESYPNEESVTVQIEVED